MLKNSERRKEFRKIKNDYSVLWYSFAVYFIKSMRCKHGLEIKTNNDNNNKVHS